MIKKLMLFLLFCTLMGCQLATEDGSLLVAEDQLVGMFITLDYIDQGEYTDLTSDQLEALINGDEMMTLASAQGKIFAQYNETLEDAYHFGIQDSYDFGIEGILFMNETKEVDGVIHSGVIGGPYVTDVHNAYSDDDQSIEGTVYLRTSDHVIAYLNPVYKTSAGTIYLLPGSGISSNGEGTMSQWFTEATTQDLNGILTEKSFEVKINVTSIVETDYYGLKEFTQNDEQLSERLITPDDVPETIARHPRTAYFILEAYSNEQVTNRTLIDQEDYINIFYFDDSDFSRSYYIGIE